MVDRQSLIPDNLPYGERKRLVDSRQAADLPVSASGGSSPPGTPLPGANASQQLPTPRSGAGLGSFNPLLEATPDQFPAVVAPESGSLDPSVRPPASIQEGLQRASTMASSAFIREVGRRLATRA